MRARAIDVETTGMAVPGSRVVEIGWFDFVIGQPINSAVPAKSVIVNPGVPIPPTAMAIHHITDEDCANGIAIDRALAMATDGCDLLIAHNVAFEKFFINTDLPWVCTYKTGMRLYGDAPEHSNQFFRYALCPDLPIEHAMPPHRAGPDAYVTAHIFQEFSKHISVDQMIDLSLLPVLQYRCRFGEKHNGKTWEEIAEIDPGFLQWILRAEHFPEDITYTASYWLRRAG